MLSSSQVKLLDARTDHDSFRVSSSKVFKNWVPWVGLVLMCILEFGNYFTFAIPQPLEKKFLNPDSFTPTELKLSSTEYNVLFSVYSAPNIILTLLGGHLLDKKGIFFNLMIYSLCLLIGQFLVTLGVATSSYGTMIAGRLVLGLGGECISMCEKLSISRWFSKKHRTMAYGFNTGSAKLGLLINSLITAKIYEKTSSLTYPFAFGFILIVVGVVCVFGLYFCDRHMKSAEKSVEFDQEEEESGVAAYSWENVKSFGLHYWLYILQIFLTYASFYSFTNNLNDLLSNFYVISISEAGDYLSIIYGLSVILSPIMGYISDRVKRCLVFMIVGQLLYLFGIYFFMVAKPDPQNLLLLPLFITGLFYSSYFPIFYNKISQVVKKSKRGLGLGFVFSARNLNLVISPLIVGAIHDNTTRQGGYFYVEVFFMIQIIIAIGVSYMIGTLYPEEKMEYSPQSEVKSK